MTPRLDLSATLRRTALHLDDPCLFGSMPACPAPTLQPIAVRPVTDSSCLNRPGPLSSDPSTHFHFDPARPDRPTRVRSGLPSPLHPDEPDRAQSGRHNPDDSRHLGSPPAHRSTTHPHADNTTPFVATHPSPTSQYLPESTRSRLPVSTPINTCHPDYSARLLPRHHTATPPDFALPLVSGRTCPDVSYRLVFTSDPLPTSRVASGTFHPTSTTH